jgi:hypothetical protein
MNDCEDDAFRDVYNLWIERVDYHQYQLIIETAKIVEELKQKKVSAKTKNEMLLMVKGLQATAKSISKVLSKYIE